MLRKLRIIIAALVFAAALFLFLDTSGYAAGCVSWIAKLQFVPAVLALNVIVIVAIVLLTFLFGRLYCSIICPLGILQDILSGIGSMFKKNRFHWRRSIKWLRAVVCVAFFALICCGMIAVAGWIEPYGTFGRMVTAATEGNSLTIAAAAALFVIIAVMALVGGRLWCNTVCPVGTILGVLSKYSLFRPVIDTSKCNGCTLCSRKCKASCINPAEHRIDYSRCVVCFDCLKNCRQGAISYRFAGCCKYKPCKDSSAQKDAAVDASRRSFITATALVASAATIGAQELEMDGGLAILQDKKIPQRDLPLLPAGSLSLRNFSRNCVSCQLCVSKCPSAVLRPSTSLERLMQPELDYRLGWCRPSCNVCSQVCPAGAIKPVSVEEKSSISIGHAVWVRENCVAVNDGVNCGNCERHCPAGAITMVEDPDGGSKIPSINAELCIGCGSCEYHCPARPLSAIYVKGHEVHSIK